MHYSTKDHGRGKNNLDSRFGSTGSHGEIGAARPFETEIISLSMMWSDDTIDGFLNTKRTYPNFQDESPHLQPVNA